MGGVGFGQGQSGEGRGMGMGVEKESSDVGHGDGTIGDNSCSATKRRHWEHRLPVGHTCKVTQYRNSLLDGTLRS